jgi:hypothetical protein
MILLLFFAGVLLLIAAVSIRWQVRTLRRVRSQPHIPSDDRAYLRKQAYRRIFTGAMLVCLAGLLAGAYLSGMEVQADQHGQNRIDGGNADKQAAAADAKQFLRVYAIYWISILLLLFLVVSLAIVDLWATRRYAWEQLRRIQSENRAMLERDLAMYRQQKINGRMRNVE